MNNLSVLRKKLLVLPEEQPAQLDKLHKARRRFLLSLKVRWYASLFLAVFFTASLIYFSLEQGFAASFAAMWLYFLLTAFMGLSSVLFKRFAYYVSKYKFATQVQIIIELIVVTLLIYISGSTLSVFWVLYPLIIIETAFLFERRAETWEVAVASTLFFIFLVTVQASSGITQGQFVFAILVPAEYAVFATVQVLWVATINFLAAAVGNYLSGIIFSVQRVLSQKVITDDLTGIFNYRYFYQILEAEAGRALRFKKTFSLILLDIDDFKAFNDKFGHAQGDKLLVRIADILKENIRRKGVDLVFRYGGEEFAIVAPETEIKYKRPIGAIALTERLRKKIGDLTPVTVSAGVGSFPLRGTRPEEFFNNVDMALFEAKESGKNKIVLAKVKRARKAA